VTVGVTLVGLSTAVAVTLFEFPGRRVFEWALLLPLAMPAYVVAYAYTDFLQFSGPLQTGLRSAFGLQGRVFPEVRNVVGAAWVFTFALYPYVYLLARTALGERTVHLMEAARLMGAPMRRRMREVALPLARPGLVTAAILSFSHTVGEFGVVLMIGGNIPGKTRVVSTQIYGHVEAMEYAQAHWLAGGMLVFSFAVLLGLSMLRKRSVRVLP
jgi:iron(III) transport system permease protein